jgi:ABC-type transport system involved in multi-copper enzyme maturation permease subunit
MATGSNLRAGWRNCRAVAYLTLDTLFWSRKTLLAAAISLLVMGLSLIGRLVLGYGWIRAPYTPAQAFGVLMSTAVIHFLVVFVTLFYGTALISEEVEAKTLTYLFLRPIPKETIMMGKFLSLLWIGLLFTMPTVFFSYVILYAGSQATLLVADARMLGKDLGIVFLAILAYGSLFSLLGAWLKHPILAGLLYAFGWEGIVSYLPGFARKLTITHYIQSIFPHDDAATAIAMMVGERAGPVESVLSLLLLSLFFLAAACLVLRDKEYVLEQ